MADQISFVEMLTPESRKLGAFCHDASGWDECEPAGSVEHRAMDPCGDSGVTASTGDPIADEEAWTCFHVAVDDIDAAAERTIAAGGSSRVPRYVTGTGFTLAYATDPEGHAIGLQQPSA